MTERQLKQAKEQYIISKLYSTEPKVWESNFEGDKRKQGKALRTLVEDGYASQTGKEYVFTDKAYLEITPIMPYLIGYWEKSRDHGWNYRHNLALVLFNNLSDEEQRYILDNAGGFDWYLLDDGFVNHCAAQIGKDDLHGPFKLEEIGPKRKELEAVNTRFKTHAVLIGEEALYKYAKEKMHKERFDGLYKMNLKWGLQQLQIVAEEDSDIAKDLLKEEDGLGILSGGGGGYGLPPNPDHWTEEAVTTRLEMLQRAVEMAQKRLEFMQKLEECIFNAGGWEKVKERYAERLKEEMATAKEE